MKKTLIFFIRIYKALPINAHNYCRCYPTCSEYTIQAINKYGAFKGLKLGIKRILKCRPGGLYGYHPLEEENIYEKNI